MPAQPTKTMRFDNDEFELRFTRRRYGRTTYTWAEVRLGDDWHDLGDPWPCVTPAKAQLQRAIQYALEKHFETT